MLLLSSLVALQNFLWVASMRTRMPNFGVMTANQNLAGYDIHVFEEPEDTGVRETAEASKRLSGCELARKIKVGSVPAKGSSNQSRDITSWECARCSPGWIEKPFRVIISRTNVSESNVKGRPSWYEQRCYWKPCGEMCAPDKCIAKKRYFWKDTKLKVSCSACKPEPFGVFWPVLEIKPREVIGKSETGQSSFISKVCAPSATSPEYPRDPDAKNIVKAVVPLLLSDPGKLSRGEEEPLVLVQHLYALVRHATQEYRHATQGKKSDIVADGDKFLRSLVEEALTELPDTSRLEELAQKISKSPEIARLRGALALCVELGMNGLGGDNDELFQHAIKGCDSADNVLHLLHLVIKQRLGSSTLPAEMRQPMDFLSSKEAPRQALELLDMFGLKV